MERGRKKERKRGMGAMNRRELIKSRTGAMRGAESGYARKSRDEEFNIRGEITVG